MKNNLSSLLFALAMMAMVGFTACGDGGNGAVNPANVEGSIINGTIDNAVGTQIYLDQMQLNGSGTQVLAKADVGEDNKFMIEVPKALERGVYRLRVGARKAVLPINGDEKVITVNADVANLSKYDFELQGSPDAASFIELMKGIMTRTKNPADVQQFVSSVKNPVAAALAALRGIPFGKETLDQHKGIATRLDKEMAGTSYARDYKAMIGQFERQLAAKMAQEKIKVGELAPDIRLPSPTGKEYSLSDLKGKVVLLDFWASWCGPCRRANPHVVETYKKYKNQGFTVFSVSLDGLDSRTKAALRSAEMIAQREEASKKKWVAAIEKDNLMWKYHVSDLKKWESAPAATYGVRGIPRTFLIDKEGKIAVVNPNHFQLENELKKLL